MFQPLLLVHVVSATIGLLSGSLAMFHRKGSGGHGAAGTIFSLSMITMGSTGAFISAFLRPIAINVIAGLLVVYLVSTAWRAAKHRAETTTLFDHVALFASLAIGSAGIICGAIANAAGGRLHGIPPLIYFVFGTVALLCAASDALVLRRGSANRMSRHVWRICLAFSIALLSFYPGQAKLFPMWLRETRLLFVPHVLLLGSMLFHGYRVSRHRRAQAAARARLVEVHA
jgi:hypothetical protein